MTFTWEEAVEFCQQIVAGEVDLETMRAKFAADDAARSGRRSAGLSRRPSDSRRNWKKREFPTGCCCT